MKATKTEGGQASAASTPAVFPGAEEEEKYDKEEICDGAMAGVTFVETEVALVEECDKVGVNMGGW